MSDRVGVAISTTGDPHRMGFLETCVAGWRAALDPGDALVVTVDGSAEDVERVRKMLNRPGAQPTKAIYRVGQKHLQENPVVSRRRQGVATNKNTGIELLMDANVGHLFLSDDDSWPLMSASLSKHIVLGQPHSMVCWGKSRAVKTMADSGIAVWNWPRGAVLYVRTPVVTAIGGMDERFGPGGHEHVEWSNRIFNAGFTHTPYPSPLSYALDGPSGPATRASILWHCEDMRRPGEQLGNHQQRRRKITSVRREDRDWEQIDKLMAECQGRDTYVGFRAHENGRASATLCENLTGLGDCAVEPEKPRSEK